MTLKEKNRRKFLKMFHKIEKNDEAEVMVQKSKKNTV